VMAARDRAAALTELLLRRSSTLGVRITDTRRVIAERQVVEVATELGTARVKVKYIDGKAVEWAPEYEDARRLAQESGRELREVIRLVAEAARQA
jgi:pyridinium-3,5-bisthiocarboxylic acid mononucleotide nickel chelatase